MTARHYRRNPDGTREEVQHDAAEQALEHVVSGGGHTYGRMLSELHEKRRELVEAHARIYELLRGIDDLEREMKARA